MKRDLTKDERALVAHAVAAVTLHHSPRGIELLAERMGALLQGMEPVPGQRPAPEMFGPIDEIIVAAQGLADRPGADLALDALRRAVNRYFVAIVDRSDVPMRRAGVRA